MIMRPTCVAAFMAAALACAPQEQAEAPRTERQASSATAMTSSNECWKRAQRADLAGRESKFDSATVSVGGRNIKLCYSRPQMRGRAIFGGLVPYGQPWRLGANEATVIHMPVAGSIAGVSVDAGSYSLYAVPDSAKWTIVVNRNAQRWGVPIGGQVVAANVGTGEVPVERISEPVEALTARFASASSRDVALVFEWERTRVRIPIRVR